MKRRAAALLQLGHVLDAVYQLEKAIQLDPNDVSLKQDLQVAKTLKDQLEELDKHIANNNYQDANLVINLVFQKIPDLDTLKQT